MKNYTKICTKCGLEKPFSEFHKHKDTKDGLTYICKDCKKIYNYQYQKENKEKLKKKRNKYEANRKRNDINYKLNTIIRINKALKRNSKNSSTIKLLGCSIKELKNHLESQFTKEMSWDNYGQNGWEIDHIQPCASFDLSNPEEQYKCFNYTNLQPLWKKENREKWHKIDYKVIYG